MIKLFDLYNRIVETTGLDVMTLGSLKAAVANCMADLTSRGYKTFKELHLSDFNNVKVNENFIEMDLPKDVRKTIYLRLFFNEGATLASRWSLSNKRVACCYFNGEFRSKLEPRTAIYYTKGDKLYIEWHTSLGDIVNEVSFGYYQKLTMSENFPTDANDVDEMETCEIDIREEFEDALVFYAAYFYYSRYVKDTDKINHYLSQYKYYVEDITHELSYEDEFNEEDAVIKLEEGD